MALRVLASLVLLSTLTTAFRVRPEHGVQLHQALAVAKARSTIDTDDKQTPIDSALSAEALRSRFAGVLGDGGFVEIVASGASLAGLEHAWGIVNLVSGVLAAMLREEVSLHAAFDLTVNAAAKDLVFDKSACSDEWSGLPCVGACLTAVVNYVGENDLLGPTTGLFVELAVALRDAARTGVTGDVAWTLAFVTMRLCVFVSAGAALGYVIDAHLLILEPKLKDAAEAIQASLLQVFTGSVAAADTSMWTSTWLDSNTVAEGCMSRIGTLAFSLTDPLDVAGDEDEFGHPRHLVRVQSQDVAAAIMSSEWRAEKQQYLFDVFLLAHARVHGGSRGQQFYFYQDVIHRYSQLWYAFNFPRPSESLGDPANVEWAVKFARLVCHNGSNEHKMDDGWRLRIPKQLKSNLEQQLQQLASTQTTTPTP